MSVWTDLLEEQRQAQLDDLLSRWHHWQLESSSSTARGHAARSTVVGEYVTSRQHDDVNGALYDDEERSTMRTVQACVDNLAEPFRSAAYVVARAQYLGNWAFQSPRLPAERERRDQVIAGARQLLIERLVSAGVIE